MSSQSWRKTSCVGNGPDTSRSGTLSSIVRRYKRMAKPQSSGNNITRHMVITCPAQSRIRTEIPPRVVSWISMCTVLSADPAVGTARPAAMLWRKLPSQDRASKQEDHDMFNMLGKITTQKIMRLRMSGKCHQVVSALGTQITDKNPLEPSVTCE